MLLVLRDAVAALRPPPGEYINTQYDAELGWSAKKSFAAPDMYGPGVGLSTNDRGFRGGSAVTDAVPAGKWRIVCSGDSFTLGHGVADAQTWCALLSSLDVETVNMGQAGYGLDQAYLAYLRDARSLQHHVHVFAFVTDDFRRMAVDRFLGYSKPTLSIEGDSLVVVGVPTVRRGNAQRDARLRGALQSLRMSELVARLRDPEEPATDRSERLTPAQVRAVTARLVAALARVNTAKQSRLVLVHLPIERDHVNEAASEWRAQMRIIADSLGVPLIDLIPALRKLSYEEARALYFQQSGAVFEGMGHLSPAGNRWAADRIAEALDSLGLAKPGQAAQQASRSASPSAR